MKNVMSLFYFLLGSIFTSCVIAAVERVVNRLKSRSAERRIFIEKRKGGGKIRGREIEEISENTGKKEEEVTMDK